MAPHSSTIAWKIPWTEEPGRLQSMRSQELDTNERLHFHFSLSCIGEGNGNPLPCSCLENPRDGGAWWAAVCAVTQSRTRLKRLRAAVSLSLVCTLLCRDSFTQYIDCEIYPLFVLWIFIVIAVWRLQQYVNRKLPDLGMESASPVSLALQADSLLLSH